MENIGREPTTIHGTLHGPGYSGGGADWRVTRRVRTAGRLPTPSTCLPSSGNLARSAGTWMAVSTSAARPPICPEARRWVFDHDFFLLLNVAVGGSWPGNPDSTTTFPQEMKVDYVRAYRR